MAVLRSENERENMRRWYKESKEKALHLLAQTEGLSQAVFSSQDNLISFLDLTARVHHYDAYNLLLIWNAYPSATYLAGYKVWERQMPQGTQILKKEHFGNGIDLVAPFTEGMNDQSCLVWYSLNVFDISQTNCKVLPPAFDSAYIQDSDHLYFLLDAVKMALGTEFDRSIIIQAPTQLHQEVGLPGQITARSITARDDLSPQELLRWFTEALSQLSVDGSGLTIPTTQLLIDSIRYCLFRIWGLDDYNPPPGSSVQLGTVTPHTLTFVHLVRDSVRMLNNLICGYYVTRRKEDNELIDLESEILPDFYK